MTAIWIIVAALIIVVAVGWYVFQRRRSTALRARFGPEYDFAVREYGGRGRAENALAARQRRMEKIHIHPLSSEDTRHFSERWREVQTRFVDDPEASILDADGLVCDLMKARGYPMSEFESRAEDLSVDHPHVVRNYRAAHAIALRREKGEVDTEDLRQALIYYRDLFDDLLETRAISGSRERR
jgi:hypothetical protein